MTLLGSNKVSQDIGVTKFNFFKEFVMPLQAWTRVFHRNYYYFLIFVILRFTFFL